MIELQKKPYVVLGLMLIPILKTGIIYGGIAWLEAYWVVNPPRPDITFSVTIVWALIDLPLVLWLWFPQRGAWIVALCYNIPHLVAHTQDLTGTITVLTPYFTLVFLLMIVQLLLLLSPGARKYYGITRHSREVHDL